MFLLMDTHEGRSIRRYLYALDEIMRPQTAPLETGRGVLPPSASVVKPKSRLQKYYMQASMCGWCQALTF